MASQLGIDCKSVVINGKKDCNKFKFRLYFIYSSVASLSKYAM